MNLETNLPEPGIPTHKGDSSKLLSILALAAGAAAVPQTSNATIIWTDISSNPAKVGASGDVSYIIDLPGTASFTFQAFTMATPISSSRWIVAGGAPNVMEVKTYGFGALFAYVIPANQSVLWNQIGGAIYHTGLMGAQNYFINRPASYNNKYVAFRFTDSTAGNAFRYGWIEVSLFNPNPALGTGPDVTIFRYAYEDSGAQIPMGAVPEPSSTALLALGALALGASGVRSWRRRRAQAQHTEQ